MKSHVTACHRFCRYADDVQVYVRSWWAGERVMTRLSDYLKTSLRLKVNRAKKRDKSILVPRVSGVHADTAQAAEVDVDQSQLATSDAASA